MDRPQTETPAARQAFDDYYDLGPRRSLAKLAEFYKKRAAQLNDPLNWPRGQSKDDFIPYKPLATLYTLEVWSSTFGWGERVLARQQEERESQMKITVLKRKDAAEKRLQKGQILQNAALQIIHAAQLGELTKEEARKLVGTGLGFMSEGLKIERLELGEENANLAPDKPIDQMSDEELRNYAAMLDASSNDPSLKKIS